MTFHVPFLFAPTRSMIPFLRKAAKALFTPASDSCSRREMVPIVMRGSSARSLTIRCSDLERCVSLPSFSAFLSDLSCTFSLLLFFTLFSTLFFTSCCNKSSKQCKMNSMKWVILRFHRSRPLHDSILRDVPQRSVQWEGLPR